MWKSSGFQSFRAPSGPAGHAVTQGHSALLKPSGLRWATPWSWVLRVIDIDGVFVISLLSLVPPAQRCPGATWHYPRRIWILAEESGRGCKATVQVPHGKAVTSRSKHKSRSFSNPVYRCKTIVADKERPVIKLHTFFQTVLPKLHNHNHWHCTEVPADRHSAPSPNSELETLWTQGSPWEAPAHTLVRLCWFAQGFKDQHWESGTANQFSPSLLRGVTDRGGKGAGLI